MSYQIADLNYWQFTIDDGIRTWTVPKFRNIRSVSEPYFTITWTDKEVGTADRRSLTLDYNDVLFGAYAPSSAAEVNTLVLALINKAWDDIIGQLGNYVPYIGATGSVDLGTYGLTTDFVAFSQTPTTGPGHAQIGYNGSTLALAYDFDNTNVRVNIGQQMYAYVKNDEAVTITKGQAVYLFGASGNKATVKLAINTSDATSATTLGLAAEDILSGQNGLVITQGVLDGIDTSAYSPGDILYLGATAGSWTATKPYAPAHLVYIGVVEKANAGAGQIFVRPQNGYELDEIHDVDLITSPPTNGQVLTYNSSTQLWTAQTPATGSGTVTSIATTSPITGGTITTSGTIGINNAAADGSTKGAAAFTASDFNDNGSGVISIDYTNGQAASGSNKGFLTSADWTTFNSKFTLPALTSGSVLFSNGTTIAQDNANLFWDDANNRLGIGTNTPANRLQVSGSITASSALGLCINFNPTLVASANNDILSCLDINPTFTNGAFTGLQNIGLRVFGSTAGVSPSLEVRQQSDTVPTWIAVRNRSNAAAAGAVSADLGISGGANQFFTGTVAGDVCFKAYSQTNTKKFFIGATAGSAANLILHPNTNVGINTSTDAGFRLDVNGTTRFQGNITISTRDIITDTTTGSKIGTATTQKIGFWNATPIVQPTTAVADATFAAVAGGTTIDTNDTFDGYTVGQVVKALRNLGILA